MSFTSESTQKKIKETQSLLAKSRKWFAVTALKVFLVLILAIGLMGASAAFGAYMGILENAPDIEDIDLSPTGIQSIIYDNAGNEIQTLVMAGSNRDPISYEDIPECVINAFIAIEDERYWTHNGIDLKGILRSVSSILQDGEFGQGGSTITQQLIKNNVFSGGSESTLIAKIQRKIQEQYLAVLAEQKWSKEEILEDYLNTINLGSNCLGIQVAAERYFGKDASELTLSEATVLAAITSNPTRYNPITNPENNQTRRKIVLQNMVDQGYITEEEMEEALADNVYERIAAVNAQYEAENDTVYSYFVDAVITQVLEDLQTKAGYSSSEATALLYSGGLRIYSTQDSDIQAIVDEEINDESNYSIVKYSFTYALTVQAENGDITNYSEGHVKLYLQELSGTTVKLIFDTEEEINEAIEGFKASILSEDDTILGENLYITLQPQVSFVLIEQSTGYVLALSGGRGEKQTSLSLNRATDSMRQPGSCFKILTSFAPALNECGATLATVYYDTEYAVGSKTFNNWWSAGYTGYSCIRDGIIYSMNIVAVRCLQETVSARLGYQYAVNFGITTLVESRTSSDGTTLTDINAALALGGITDGVTNLELTAAYAAIANGGVYNEPILYTKITDNTGKVILDNTQYQKTRTVISEATAYLLIDAMSASMQSNQYYTLSIYSTSTKARLDNMACAGKSGTTSDNNDLWFVGFTPYYTAGIWEGYDVNSYISESTASTKTIWKAIMTRVHEGLSYTSFTKPSTITTAQICTRCGNLAVTGLCDLDERGSMISTVYFAVGTVPTTTCTCHELVEICSESGLLATEYCPEDCIEEHVFMIISDSSTTETYDSAYVAPTETCDVHDENSTTEEETEEEETEEETTTEEATTATPTTAETTTTTAAETTTAATEPATEATTPETEAPTAAEAEEETTTAATEPATEEATTATETTTAAPVETEASVAEGNE